MSEERPSFGPGLVLAQVSLRVILPLLGGVIIGLVVDNFGQTAPQFALIGLAVGTLVSILWLRAFIVSNVRRIRREEHERAAAADAEEHEQPKTESA
jgi:multisubunit Na+/H+ antiporter MnhB subunit